MVIWLLIWIGTAAGVALLIGAAIKLADKKQEQENDDVH